MPTNKLWLEHTEKAAWESVQALREKLADAEKRMQRLAPPIEGWQPLLDELDAIKSERGISGETYAQVVSGLVQQMRRERGELRELEQQVADLRSASLIREVSSAPRASTRPAFDSADDDFDLPSAARRRELNALLRRYEESLRDHPVRDLDELIDVLSVKIADLADLEEPGIADAASDVAVLALRAAKLARESSD